MDPELFPGPDDIEARLKRPLDVLNRRSLTNLRNSMGSADRALAPDELLATVGAAGDLSPERILKTYGTGQPISPEHPKLRDKGVLLLDLSGGLISKYGTLVVDGRLIVTDTGHMPRSWRASGHPRDLHDMMGVRVYDPDTGRCICSYLEPFIRLDDPRGYFLFNSRAAFHNFGHFVHDTLCQVAFYDEACERAGGRLIPIVTSSARRICGTEFRYPMLKLLFESVITDSSDIVYLDGRNAEVESCFTATVGFETDSFSASQHASDYLRAKIAKTPLPMQKVEGVGKKVWISRGDGTTDRKAMFASELDNLHLVDRIAENCGFSVVMLSKLKVEEIIGMMQEVEVIAGVHGAGLLNTVLCPVATRMIECKIAPWTFESTWLMAESFGLTVERVGVLPSLVGGGRSIDLGHLFQALRRH